MWPCPTAEASANENIFWINIWFMTEIKLLLYHLWWIPLFRIQINEQVLVPWLFLLLLVLQWSTREHVFLEASNYPGNFSWGFFVPLIKDNQEKKNMATNCWSCKGIYWDDYRLNEAGMEIHFPDLLTLCTAPSNWIKCSVFTQPQ